MTVYRKRKSDPRFAQRWEDAVREAVDHLHAEAWRRAVEGMARPIYQGGVLVGYERVFSDRLAELLLKGHMPQMFDREPRQKQVGNELPQALKIARRR